jgi:hypothetical protein
MFDHVSMPSVDWELPPTLRENSGRNQQPERDKSASSRQILSLNRPGASHASMPEKLRQVPQPIQPAPFRRYSGILELGALTDPRSLATTALLYSTKGYTLPPGVLILHACGIPVHRLAESETGSHPPFSLGFMERGPPTLSMARPAFFHV